MLAGAITHSRKRDLAFEPLQHDTRLPRSAFVHTESACFLPQNARHMLSNRNRALVRTHDSLISVFFLMRYT